MGMGEALGQQLAAKVGEVKEIASGLTEEQAAKAPAEGEWSAKQVLSHLCGDDEALSMYEFKRFLDEDTPALGITPGSYGDVRKDASISELVSKIDSDYSKISSFLAGLNDEQLQRKAHVPFLKETPLGEYPTLGGWAGAVINFHLTDHVNQLRTLSQ
jgi:DinB superfamily